MKSVALQFFTDRDWVLVALFIFIIFFVTLLVRVFGTASGRSMEDGKWMVFEEGRSNE